VTPTALLAELEAAGVHLTRHGDRLHYQTSPGVRIAPYAEAMRAHEPGLLRELVQREIVAAASVEPAQFDRDAYDRLWARWYALEKAS
jgi:hypothetical protein